MTELQGKIYLTKADMPKGCDQCPFCNGADECMVQNEDANFLADTWDDLRSGCPLEEIEPVTVQEWISVKERLPSEEEWLSAEGCSFLCKVLIPIPGGAADNKQQVIGYDRLHRRWACEDMIVTHWMPLPKGEDTP